MEYSVLMTVFCKDNPEYFALALDSMINQTLKPDEIVLVKDGPITKELQNVIDERIMISNIVEVQLEKNMGLGIALNEGLKVCKNELIARMDADDISLPKRCEKQIKEFENNPELDIVGLAAYEFENNPENIIGVRKVPLTNEDIFIFAKKRDPFNHPTVMYRKSKLIEVGGYKNYRKNQDTSLWIDMLKRNAICMNIDEDLFRFRFDENTYKKRKSWVNTKTLMQIRKEAYQDGFNSLYEYIIVAFVQICIFILPIKFQKRVYRTLFRK